MYLVTNRHVAQCWDNPDHLRDVLSESIRVNLKTGTSRSYNLDIGAWIFPSDDSVDLAVMPIGFPQDFELDMYSVSFAEPATKDYLLSHRIAEGSPVLLSGYFVQYPGIQKFQSIVRQGILSMMPDEPIKTTTGKLGTLYLADVHIFLGNSGSPVMVTQDAEGVGGYHLLGVVSGYVYEDADFKLEIATTTTGKVSANSGIAIIVPVDFLKVLLDSPRLKEAREQYLSTLVSPATGTKH
ncbi:MAG: S1C family serine protease [Terriglobales bacterium]